MLGALAGASGSGCYMGRCLCWCETGEARRVQNHPAPTAASAEECAGGTPLYGVQCLRWCPRVCCDQQRFSAIISHQARGSGRVKAVFLRGCSAGLCQAGSPATWDAQIWAQQKLLLALPEPPMVGLRQPARRRGGKGQHLASCQAGETGGMQGWMGCAAAPLGARSHGAVTAPQGWLHHQPLAMSSCQGLVGVGMS